MGIREAFYMTFGYKEIRLCLAIGLAMLIVTGYGVQARVRRSSQDGRRRTVGVQRIGMASSVKRSGMAVSVQRSGMAVSVQRSASGVQVWRSASGVQVWR